MPIFYKGFGQGSRNQQGFLSFIYVHYTDKVLFKDGNARFILVQALINISDQII